MLEKVLFGDMASHSALQSNANLNEVQVDPAKSKGFCLALRVPADLSAEVEQV